MIFDSYERIPLKYLEKVHLLGNKDDVSMSFLGPVIGCAWNSIGAKATFSLDDSRI